VKIKPTDQQSLQRVEGLSINTTAVDVLNLISNVQCPCHSTQPNQL